MCDRDVIAIDQKVPEWHQIIDRQRVDNRVHVVNGHLQQAKIWAISTLGNEFGIEANKLRPDRFFAKNLQL